MSTMMFPDRDPPVALVTGFGSTGDIGRTPSPGPATGWCNRAAVRKTVRLVQPRPQPDVYRLVNPLQQSN